MLPSPLLLATGLCLLGLAGSLFAQSAGLGTAQQALREGIYPVAIQQARAALGQAPPDSPEQRAASLLLAEALLGDHQLESAGSVLKPLVATNVPGASALYAQWLARQGRWSEARDLYRTLRTSSKEAVEAALGEAESLQALGQAEDAIALLEPLHREGKLTPLSRLRLAELLASVRRLTSARAVLRGVEPAGPAELKWKLYTEGRILLAEDQPAPALELFQEVLAGREYLSERLLLNATFGTLEARVLLHGLEAADRVLEGFIAKYPESTYLAAAFARLDQVYARQEDPSEGELKKWISEPPTRRAALARYYQAKMQFRLGKVDRAGQNLDTLLRQYASDPVAVQASILRSEVYLQQGNNAEAVRVLEAAMRLTNAPGLRAQIELRTGLVYYQQGESLLAATLFEEAARHSERIRAVATFNAALAWLQQGNQEQFRKHSVAFVKLQPDSPLRGDLMLEAALVQARLREPSAREALTRFIHVYPQSPRVAEARLALAELEFTSAETRPISRERLAPVANYLRTVNELPQTPETKTQADYLAFCLAESEPPRDDAKLIALARKFLADHPVSAQAPEVRMKLGQIFFQQGDFASAGGEFATVVEHHPTSSYAESALYLAGQSALKLMNPGSVDRALQFFEHVIERNGPLKLYARQEQALVQMRLEKEDQALALYEIILASEPAPPADLQQAALCGKGDSLLALGRKELPKTARLTEAVAAFQELATLPKVSATWKNQALYKKAKALEQLGRRDDALAAYYSVLDLAPGAEREYFWFYKAGFDGARMLEQQQQWKAAAGLYQKMALVEGPRTAEARTRLRELRLEHFLWED